MWTIETWGGKQGGTYTHTAWAVSFKGEVIAWTWGRLEDAIDAMNWFRMAGEYEGDT